MDDKTILAHIDDLVAEEHELRARSGQLDDEAQQRLGHLEEQLDQSWDLLRQRRARRDSGEDPGLAEVRPAEEVERYLD
jgi:hypothetical protein